MVSPESILLFGGAITVSKGRKKAIVDGWLAFNMQEHHIVLFKVYAVFRKYTPTLLHGCAQHLRNAVDELLLRKVRDANVDITKKQDIILHVLKLILHKQNTPSLPAQPPSIPGI
jgi:hypothetical protein